MDDKHTMRTRKFLYMISEINDYHSNRVEFGDDTQDFHSKYKIHFGSLRNEVSVRIDEKGDVISAYFRFNLDGEFTEDRVHTVVPDWVEVTQLEKRDGHTSVRGHIYNSSGTVDGRDFVSKLEKLKSRLVESGMISLGI